MAFALAATLATDLPPIARAATLTGACIVAFGRMYSGAHLPLDVVGGVGLGLVVGTLSRGVR